MERSEPSVQHSDKENCYSSLLSSSSILRVATTIILNILLLLRVICVFPNHRPLNFLLRKGGHRIFNVRTGISACCADKSETVTAYGVSTSVDSAWRTRKRGLHGLPPCRVMMSWCLMSSDVIWHIRDKLWPMPKHGSIKSTYVRCMRCLAVTCHLHFLAEWPGFFTCYCGNTGVERIPK